MSDGSELMTSTEVSRLLGISTKTVHRRVEAGQLTAAQKLPGPNGAYLFRYADVEAYLERQRAAAGEHADGGDEGDADDVDAEGDRVRPRVGAA